MKVGFTGTREGMTCEQYKATCKLYYDLQPIASVHNCDCVGADEQFHGIAYYSRRIGHPPIDERFRAFCDFDESRERKECLERNRDIVDECDVLIAAPKEPT